MAHTHQSHPTTPSPCLVAQAWRGLLEHRGEQLASPGGGCRCRCCWRWRCWRWRCWGWRPPWRGRRSRSSSSSSSSSSRRRRPCPGASRPSISRGSGCPSTRPTRRASPSRTRPRRTRGRGTTRASWSPSPPSGTTAAPRRSTTSSCTCGNIFLALGSIVLRACSHPGIHPSIHPPLITHSKAANPDRVYAGVVQQNNDGDVDCLYDYCRIIKDERNIEPKVGGRRRQAGRQAGRWLRARAD